MNANDSVSLPAFVSREFTADGVALRIGRKLRSFDVDAIGPEYYPGVTQFLRAWKLAELTEDEIRVFLMLRDNTSPDGHTGSCIAAWLNISMHTTLSCLRELDRKGFAVRACTTPEGEPDEAIERWLVDTANPWVDAQVLFREFAYLDDLG